MANMQGRNLNWLRRSGCSAFWFTKLAYEDMKSTRFGRGLFESIRLWCRGFYTASFVSFSCEENRLEDYLSDVACHSRTKHIDGAYSIILQDKLIFYNVMRVYHDFIPKLYALIQQGRLIKLQDNNRRGYASPVTDVLKYDKYLVIKPFSGWQGKGVMLLKHEDGRILLNNDEVSLSALKAILKGLDGYIVTAFAEQGSYASSIFPESANTVRIISMWDLKLGEPFVASAVHRFGTKYNIPMDHMYTGGIATGIDIKTGVMGPAARFPGVTKEALVWFSRHPDTGSQIEGVQIPNWEKVTENILAIAASLPHIPYIGWDIIVQDNGFKIIEGNNLPGIAPMQMLNGPLLKDHRVRSFYAEYGVI